MLVRSVDNHLPQGLYQSFQAVLLFLFRRPYFLVFCVVSNTLTIAWMDPSPEIYPIIHSSLFIKQRKFYKWEQIFVKPYNFSFAPALAPLSLYISYSGLLKLFISIVVQEHRTAQQGSPVLLVNMKAPWGIYSQILTKTFSILCFCSNSV